MNYLVIYPIFLLIFTVLFTNCQSDQPPFEVTPGISEELARYRKKAYSEVKYDLSLSIPAIKSEAIRGEVTVSFRLTGKPDQHLVLDFNVDSLTGSSIRSLNPEIDLIFQQEHILIDKKHLQEGLNALSIAFNAGDQSLNRNEDYLYTLFVPDRASTAFPCFDQPDLKARFTLTLDVPDTWQAVTNYSLAASEEHQDRQILTFHETAPLPTYLFAFAAGDFKTLNHESSEGMPMTMYFRETDSAKVQSNQAEIFRLHQEAIRWMEDYTQIQYPFEKFDFVLLPPFQYGGMEHPGAIFYRERSLFLDEAATVNDKLGRASLIAHETAHIWFGDLVTMKWFNDVWAKEVFANFMADKIVNPSFPEIDHKMKFLLRMHPAAYSVDRTRGANAIRQHLGNLKNAGLMYGPIIYQKAPVMMKQLENLVGEDTFKTGMQEYLQTFAFENADWNDLIRILDQKTGSDLQTWSKTWIEEPGMPVYTITEKSEVKQHDPLEKDRLWMQELQLTTDRETIEIYQDKIVTPFELKEPYEWLILNGTGTEYGGFILDEKSKNYFLENVGTFTDNYLRGRIWLNMYETFLAGQIDPEIYFMVLLDHVKSENEPLLLDQLLTQLQVVYWNFFDSMNRAEEVGGMEQVLLDRLTAESSLNIKVSLYRAYTNIFQSKTAYDRLLSVWQEQTPFMDIPLSSRDYTSLAMKLALRSDDPANSEKIIRKQLERLDNPDDRKRLTFIKPSLSPDQQTRDQFFESLKKAENRENEPWVLTALSFLHHPIRQPHSVSYIEPGLKLLGEIQRTGDIFFPGQWVEGMLESYQSEEVLAMVREFMASDTAQQLNPKLQLKVWVAADLLKRSISVKEKYMNPGSSQLE